MFFFKKYTLPHDAPSRENMIRSFMIGPRLQGVDFPKEDLAEKQFDLLVEYGIIKGLKGYTNQKHLLYYATQKSGPHQIPTKPRTNTREYYICNNQSWLFSVFVSDSIRVRRKEILRKLDGFVFEHFYLKSSILEVWKDEIR